MNTPSADQAGSKVQNNEAYQWLVTGGLIAFGILHLLMAWICAQLVLGGGGGDASSQGALKDLASKPFGGVLMVLMAVGLFAMAVWQAIEAAIGHTQFSDKKKRIRKRVSSCGRAILYAALGFTAASLAMGGQTKDSNQTPKDATATLMAQPFGQVLVALLAAVVIGIGISQIVKGVRRKFVQEDLDGSVPEWAKKLGAVGWCAKGAALAVAGLLIGWAAITYDPQKAAGLDGALKALQQAPMGSLLLLVMALGFVAFGVYCFVWSRNVRHTKA